ncbi:putative monooxygenase [Dactylonectria estremocensis]|uniref:Monooxygenase n=1 Tax=Dactylonectria estremocensis TaxID=1079267 RepID=A0A9P9FEQ7_9HYPO|nr:putative monooxygenase [Dactylonectria estremocensis]
MPRLAMEDSPVVIVGAGPSGLMLGLSLAKHGVHSIILEKEQGITQDPRGVSLSGDAIRILYDIGIGDKLRGIGHEVEKILLHKASFKNDPFFSIDTTRDALNQAVPEVIMQVQPRLEHALRCIVSESAFCDLKEGCEVTAREEQTDSLRVDYIDSSGVPGQINCRWLIGADGKRGIVRNHFLEPTAAVRQETGLFRYEATWLAANLEIRPPTPKTHPEFPLWKLGFTPKGVYDLFWPKSWHFCSPPGNPTACGRFGPHEARLWRHEIALQNWDDSMDPNGVLLQQLLPSLTRDADESGQALSCGAVSFPAECINILRCRPFAFAQKVVNKWFHNRTILIGDAAHVFPPFGGQGIACGIWDAHGLAWRLALLEKIRPSQSLANRLLGIWALERRQGVDDSTRLTMINGRICNEEDTFTSWLLRSTAALLKRSQSYDRLGYKPTKGGFYLAGRGGGGKLAQVYVGTGDQGILLSDEILVRHPILTLLIVGRGDANEETKVKNILRAADLPPAVLSAESVVFLDPNPTIEAPTQPQQYSIPRRQDLAGVRILPGYDEGAYMTRLGHSTKFAIIRPDTIIFSAVKTLPQLKQRLVLLKRLLDPQQAVHSVVP